MNMCKDPDLMSEPEGIATALRPTLLKTFPAAQLGRLVVIPYYLLRDTMLRAIIRLQLGRIENGIRANYGIPFTYTDETVKLIASRCTELESAGRMIDIILTNNVLPAINQRLLASTADGKLLPRVHINAVDSDFVYEF
jgi:type VI secretion system protein VasG